MNPSWFRFFGILRSSGAHHFYIVQAVTFLYTAYRFASRDFTIYGFPSSEQFDYPRPFTSIWPGPPLKFTTGQFIYDFIERPGPDTILYLQLAIIVICTLGFLGVIPRICACVTFLLSTHLTSFVHASNEEVDSATLVLFALLVLSLTPTHSFYRLGNFRPQHRSVDHHWPLFVLLWGVGLFYFTSGINKILDVGPHWPFVVRLDFLAEHNLANSIFSSKRWTLPWLCLPLLSSTVSALSGLFTLVVELAGLCLLFVPRLRLFLVLSYCSFHFMVLGLSGINFLGNAFILLLCLDWNLFHRQLELRRPTELAWLDRYAGQSVTITDAQTLSAVDEHGEEYIGNEILEQLWARRALYLPVYLAIQIPGAIKLLDFWSPSKALRP